MKESELPELPGGWVWTRLESCIEILDSKRVPINSDDREERIAGKSTSGLYPYYGATGKVGWIDDYLFDEELILLGEDGAPFFEQAKNKAYIIKGKSWINNHAHVLKAIAGITLNQFLCNYLNVFDYHGYVTGTTRAKLNQSPMRKIPIPLPPLPEQRRIVLKLEELFTRLDAGISELRKMQVQLKRYRRSVLKAAVEGKLVSQDPNDEQAEKLLDSILLEHRTKWEADLRAKGKDPKKTKYVEPHQPNIDGLPHLPESWKWVSWEAILAYKDGAFKRGPFGSALTKSIFVESGYKVYEQYCPIDDDCSFGRYYITPAKFEELKTFEVRAGDYLISCSGVTLGRITRVPQEFEKGIINQALLRVRINDRIISHLYFVYLFRSPFFQKLLFDNSTGTAIPNVKGVKELKAIPIPLPPLAEQRRIVAEVERRLSIADGVEKTVGQSLTQAERLRQSILKKAFDGRLVAQDASDEPAGVLLERIKQEKERIGRKRSKAGRYDF